jgi:hypothetical protein
MTVINWVCATSQVGEARRTAAAEDATERYRLKMSRRGLCSFATEMAINLVKHAGEGLVAVNEFAYADRSGIELLVLAKAISRAAAGGAGFSKTGNPGTWLGAVARVSDRHAIDSRPGVGSAVMARFLNVRYDGARRCRNGASSSTPISARASAGTLG